MKTLSALFSGGLALSAMVTPLTSSANEWTDGTTKEHCVVKGVENIRTPRYEDTEETREIMAMERLLCQQLAEHAFGELGKGLHEEGIILLEGGGILNGRDQQVAMFKDLIGKKGLYLTYEPAEAHVSKDGTMAWAIGLVKLQFPGQELEVQKYASVWEKVDGQWLNVVEMRNKNY